MIAKITSGADAAGCCGYDLDHDHARILVSEGLDVDPQMADRLATSEGDERRRLARQMSREIAASFALQASMNPRVTKPVHHVAISFLKEDAHLLTDELMVQISREYLKRMGYENTQFMVTRHDKDGGNPHFHIMLNAVCNDGKRIDTDFERLRNIEVCKELKQNHGLTFAPDKARTRVNALHGREKLRYQTFHDVKDTLAQSLSCDDFRRRLLVMGIRMNEVRRGDGSVQGVTFTRLDRDNGHYVTFKGSELGRAFTYGNIQNHFSQGEDHGERYQQDTHHGQDWSFKLYPLSAGGTSRSIEQDLQDPKKKRKRKLHL